MSTGYSYQESLAASERVNGRIEDLILPFVLDHARPRLDGHDFLVRALRQLAGEDAKHIHLFKRFREEFEAHFGTRCEVIGPPAAERTAPPFRGAAVSGILPAGGRWR